MENKLPKDWKIVELKEVVSLLGDGLHGTPKYTNESDYYFINGNNLGNGKITIKENTKKVSKEEFEKYKKLLNDKTVLVSINGTLGNVAFYNNEKVILGKSACYFNVLDCLDKKYIKILLSGLEFLNYAHKSATGSTIPNVSLKTMREFKFPLPPLETQQTIVSKIEELFSELDKGIEDLKTAQQQLKTYRQSVLKWAFEGKLTNEKVKEGELPEGWEWVKISDISRVVRGGSPRPAGDPKFYDGDIPFLKVADLTKDNGIYLTTFKYTIKEAGLHKTRQITPNTLLLSNSGATLGVPKICMINATMNDGVAAFLDLDERSNHYLYYFWVSKTSELRGINMGAGQPNLNTDLIKDYKVPYCSFEEQHRIVQEIESRLSVADKMEESIAQSLQQAEALRQSILKKAFSGELV
jgi:type I restriction enzyme S subunit